MSGERSRRLRWGAVAVAAYGLAAFVTAIAGLVDVRPLYDGGGPPPPYRFVNPPADLAATNVPPEGGETSIDLAADGSRSGGGGTNDGQVRLDLKVGAFAARAGDERVGVTVGPLDPAGLGDPPDGLEYEGNAYEIAAYYRPSGAAATLREDALLVMRYPFQAEAIYRREGNGWVRLESAPEQALHLFAQVDRLGTFVAAGVGAGATGSGGLVALVAVGAGTAAALAAFGVTRRRAIRRRWRAFLRWLRQPSPPASKRRRR